MSALPRVLSAAGVAFRGAGARSRVRDRLRADGLEERIGYFGRHLSLDQVIEDFERGDAAADDTARQAQKVQP